MHRFDVHRVFYGQKAEMTNYQVRVYGTPRVRAIATTELDTEKAQTAIILALSQGFVPLSRDFHDVVFFTPIERRDWVVGQIQIMATNLTARIRSEQQESPEAKEQGRKVLRILKEWISHLKFQRGEVSWPSVAPDHWAAFGFTEKDKIPSWVKISLG